MTDSAEPLVFMMGQFEAVIPQDRVYSTKHLWLQKLEPQLYRVGFTSYSVRLLQDVYFLEWRVEAPTILREKQEIGEVESSKALSTLYAPAVGELVQFNEHLLEDPTPINTDCYGTGWLYDLRTTAIMKTPAEYVAHLDEGWEKTQNMLKGQIN
ncbi:Glycine cleavage system H protein [Polystyrenella longa]|uniref:Glycine cleavage system H protein n=1 Tax=Polystyrenella longa TaxID=2528007 RepID=A0A518CRJ1_9PLAN|nr:glycine cleavage system protein H [Polystyrenella longa]QDU81847.1 Glycine cleavage system H protein [Polystyrenella longa]